MKPEAFDHDQPKVNSKTLEMARQEVASRILIVDDDPDILHLLTFSLEREGYKVVSAKTASEAFTLFDEFAPDVMCVDYNLPDMDGPDLVKKIRARNDMVYVPIVMLTAMSGGYEANKISSIESGVDAYLTKPISHGELRVVVRSMLRIKAAQDKMLDALERVAQVQDELLHYERKQGQFQAMRATVATVMRELETPLSAIGEATNNLDMLMAETIKPGAEEKVQKELKEIWHSLHIAQNALRRLASVTHFATKELADETIILDLDKS